MTTNARPLSELPVNHPDQPWNIDFTEAKLMLQCFMRDSAEQANDEQAKAEQELCVMLTCFMNSTLFDQMLDWQRIAHLARARGTPIGDHLFDLGIRPPVDLDRIREHQEAIVKARKP